MGNDWYPSRWKPHREVGVLIFGLFDGRAHWARFYLEPVDDAGAGITETDREAAAR
jgi:hypothetical protein